MWTTRLLSLAVISTALSVELLFGARSEAQDKPTPQLITQVAHSADVRAIAFSSDGQLIASASEDGTLKLWNSKSGRLLRTFWGGGTTGHHGPVTSLAFSADGSRVVSGGWDQSLKLWNTSSGDLLRTFKGHSGIVHTVGMSPDGALLASGSSDLTVRLWDAATGELRQLYKGHSKEVISVAFCPNGKGIASAGRDYIVNLWSIHSPKPDHVLKGHPWWNTQVACSPDGAQVVSGLRMWDSVTGELLYDLRRERQSATEAGFDLVNFSQDGKYAVSSYEGTIAIWETATGRVVRKFEHRHGSPINALAISSDAARVVTGLGNAFQLWDAITGRPSRWFGTPLHHKATQLAFSRDGSRAAMGYMDGTVNYWDVVAGRLVKSFKAHTSRVTSLSLSGDGTLLITGASFDRTIRVWRANGQRIKSLDEPDALWDAPFSPNGTSFALYAGDSRVTLRDVKSGDVLKTFDDKVETEDGLRFSPNGTRLAVVSYKNSRTVNVWDVATGKLLRSFGAAKNGERFIDGHETRIVAVTFSPSGKRLVTGDDTGFIYVWDIESGRLLHRFKEERKAVKVLVFASDETPALTWSGAETLRLVNLKQGLSHRLIGHTGELFSAIGGFSRVVSGGSDGTIRVWNVGREAFGFDVFGTSQVTFTADPGMRWLAMDTSGFFSAGGEGDNAVHIVRGLDAVTIDQVHQSLFNPDLVREALAGDPDGEVQEAAKVINLEKVLDSGPAPTVAVTSPAADSQSSGDVVTVAVRITDKGKGVGRIEWRVNGITAAVAASPEGKGPVYMMARELALDSGENTIEVVAYNGSNLLASLPARTTVTFTGPADRTKAKLHVLAIGINQYVDKGRIERGRIRRGWQPLKLATKDAEAFGTEMERAGGSLYQKVIVTPLLDTDATRENIEKAIDRIAKDVHPRDTFVLFAAAHGTSENGRFYLIPQDYQSGPGALQQRAVGQDHLQDWLANRIKARKAIILLDTCESGALVAGHLRSRTEEAASEAGVGRLHEATGRPVLTAAATGQFAHEGVVAGSGERHGIFTWALLEALRKGDSNTNGTIELSELVAHVQSIVPALAAKYGGTARGEIAGRPTLGKQAARFGSRGEDFTVVNQLR